MIYRLDLLKIAARFLLPASPKTKPRREKVIRYESFVDFEPYIQEAVKNIETILIKPQANKADLFNELF